MLDVYYASGGGFIEPVSYGKPVFIVVYKFRKNDFGAEPVKFAQSVKKIFCVFTVVFSGI